MPSFASFKASKILILAIMCALFQCSQEAAGKAELAGRISEIQKSQADGELVNGVRVIKMRSFAGLVNLNVYRGEEVRLVWEKIEFPYWVQIPEMNVSGNAKAGEDLSIEFKAKDAGVFSLVCKDNCPKADKGPFAKINVLEYEVNESQAVFKSISPKTASEMIASKKPFILDVRTPAEFREGRIAGAALIPVQELAARIGEIDSLKNKPVLVYCRSGNRSIPASQILIRNGFKEVYNMQNGIIGWSREQLPVE